jgi:hypothetical protein
MKRISWLLLAGLVAACSSSGNGKESAKADAAVPPATVADAAVAPAADAAVVPAVDAPVADATRSPDSIDATTLSTGADAARTDSELDKFGCPIVMPGLNTACISEGAFCDYSAPLTCPVGCSGGDLHGYQCSQGRWVDYRHTSGAPQCRCQALSFPNGMQGTWLIYQSGSLEPQAWVRFSALGGTLSDAGSPGQGTIEILAGPDKPTASSPWWSCNGQGQWFITQTPDSFEVRPSATCASSSKSEIYTVTSRQGDLPSSMYRCLLHITIQSTSGAQMEACKYSDSQCDATMTTCQEP